MAGTREQRLELAGFLRSQRERADRAELGLPPARGGRTTGISREEVAVLAAMSATWFTWLEQARAINPSRQVIDSLARVLSLTSVEHDYVLGLTGYTPSAPAVSEAMTTAPVHLQRLLDGMPTFPAFAVAADWRILGWNRAYARLYPNIVSVPAATRNLLRLVFTDPYVREMLPDWGIDSRHFVAEFRADVGSRITDPDVARLVDGLLAESTDFRAVWQDHEVRRFASRARRFHHRRVGDLEFEHNRLFVADAPGAHLVVYTPLPDGETAGRLAVLLA